MLPGEARAHLEHERPRCRRRAPSSVSGSPISLLNDPGLACTRNVRRERGRGEVLGRVLPAEPVMPTTVASPSRVAGDAGRAPRARRAGRSTCTTAAHAGRRGRPRRVDERDGRAARERVGDEVVAVALGAAARRSTLPAPSVRESIDERRRAARRGRPATTSPPVTSAISRRGQLHAERSSSSRATTAVVERRR